MRKLLISTFASFLFVSLGFSQDKKSCEVSWTAEVGLFSSYVGQDVGDTFYPHKVVQGSTNVEFCGNKRVSGGINLWQSLSTKENPVDGGTEFDVLGYVDVKLTNKTKVNFNTAAYFLPGLKIYKAGASISHSIKVSKTVEAELSNDFSYYRTSKEDEVPGGVVNKAKLSFSRPFGKTTATVAPAISLDNNPFGLGASKVASMVFLNGSLSYQINDKLSISGTVGVSNPLFGDTTRGFRKFGGIGLTYVFK